MAKLIFLLLGNIIMFPINLALLIPRLIYKITVDYNAGLWIVVGNKTKVIEVKGAVKIH